MSKQQIGAIVIVAVVFAGGGFFGGYKYAKSKTPARGTFAQNLTPQQRQQFAGAAGGAGARGRGGAAGGGFATGEIISKDDKSITVKQTDGSTKIVFFADSTTVGKMTQGSANDLTVGENVIANGSSGSDGSITAQNIQIRPASSTPATTK